MKHKYMKRHNLRSTYETYYLKRNNKRKEKENKKNNNKNETNNSKYETLGVSDL
jgi:hypothetical protein